MKRHIAIAMTAAVSIPGALGAGKPVKLMTLDPGHFHAALVQKSMYDSVDPVVDVYAPAGPDLDLHLARIEAFNTRPENPTAWKMAVHRCDNPLERMLAEKRGNVVVLSGNNARKSEYILKCVEAGLNVLADKPMVIDPKGFEDLKKAFKVAANKHVFLYDIMTERFEVTTRLQRELSHMPALFGKAVPGTPEEPSITKESVHHFFKYVSGKPLRRPPWFFDVEKEGEGIVDVATHLVDLIQWECFPGEILKTSDVEMLSARTWTTPVTREQFKKATGLDDFTPDLKKYVDKAGVLQVRSNGEMIYKLRGRVCKVSVEWKFQAPEGAGDTHFSIMRGTHANLVIRQGAGQGYKPVLYIEAAPAKPVGGFSEKVNAAIAALQKKWPGVSAKPTGKGNAWEVVIPEKYKLGHEAHFAQVTKNYLQYLSEGQLPRWEVPNMLVKYHTIMEAYRMSRKE
jgi:predicted dehydrogenase